MKEIFLMVIMFFELLIPGCAQNIDTTSAFIDTDVDSVIEILEDGTGIVFFSAEDCPWCKAVSPVLDEIAKEKKLQILRYNPQEIRDNVPENKEGTKEYNKLLTLLNEFLDEYTDENGNSYGKKRIYLPDLYFVKDGEIIGHHLGAVESYRNPEIDMNQMQVEELREIYENLFTEYLK